MKAIITPYQHDDLDGLTPVLFTFHLDIGEGRPYCVCFKDYLTPEACADDIAKFFPNTPIETAAPKTIQVR